MIELNDLPTVAHVDTTPARNLDLDAAPVAALAVVATVARDADVTGGQHTTGPGGLTARASGKVQSARDLARKADLDWSPVLAPLTVGGATVPTELGRAIVRSDTRAPIGIVGARYVPIDHGILFDLADDGLKIRHTVGGAQLAKDAVSIAEAAGVYAGRWSNAALAMMGRRMSDREMQGLAQTLIPGESKRSQNSRDEMMRAWVSAPGARPGTVFGAMQAVTHYTTHTIGKADAREEALVFGTGAATDMQATAWWALETDDSVAALATVPLYVARA